LNDYILSWRVELPTGLLAAAAVQTWKRPSR
jgi:hypothetical protein